MKLSPRGIGAERIGPEMTLVRNQMHYAPQSGQYRAWRFRNRHLEIYLQGHITRNGKRRLRKRRWAEASPCVIAEAVLFLGNADEIPVHPVVAVYIDKDSDCIDTFWQVEDVADPGALLNNTINDAFALPPFSPLSFSNTWASS